MQIIKNIYKILGLAFLLNILLFMVYPPSVMPIYKYINKIKHQHTITSDAELNQIFYRLTKDLPNEIRSNLKLKVVEDDTINAFVTADGQVVIYTGLVTAANRDANAVAFVLGHEVAHYILGHHRMIYNNDPMMTSVWMEQMADNMGLLLSNAAGFNGCTGGKNIFNTFLDKTGTWLYSSSHPLPVYRLYMVNKLCENMI